MNSTIKFYNDNAKEYIELTREVDMSHLYRMFENSIPVGGKILDVGCGSGRDTKHFVDEGYIVTAIDGSEELCKAASEYSGVNVIEMDIENLDLPGNYDGIWACASLLHVEKRNMKSVISKLFSLLNNKGILYASWKYGDGEREEGGKHYSDYTEEQIGELISSDRIKSFKIWTSKDQTRVDTTWVNLLVYKENLLRDGHAVY